MGSMPISPVKVALNEIDNYGGHNPEIRGGEGLVLGSVRGKPSTPYSYYYTPKKDTIVEL